MDISRSSHPGANQSEKRGVILGENL